jgi:hypothetical protein
MFLTAFKAGITPSRIARQFGLSQSEVRKALALPRSAMTQGLAAASGYRPLYLDPLSSKPKETNVTIDTAKAYAHQVKTASTAEAKLDKLAQAFVALTDAMASMQRDISQLQTSINLLKR